jgi:hypothetical protein
MTAELDALRPILSAGFDPKEVHQRKGQNGMTFDYIDDETVMDRLDDAVGLGRHSWSFTVVTDTCVRGRVDIVWPDGSASFYEDFGYANNQSGDTLKEAVTDSIRRIGRFVGVARDLYRKHDAGSQSQRPSQPAYSAPQRSAPTRPAPMRPSVVDEVPEEPEDLFPPIGNPANAVAPSHCPIHDVPWAGGPGDYWHKDPEGKYCRHPDNIKRPRRAS